MAHGGHGCTGYRLSACARAVSCMLRWGVMSSDRELTCKRICHELLNE